MNAVVMMSALLLGQCSGGSCPAPSFGPYLAPSFDGFLGESPVLIGEPIYIQPAPAVARQAAPKPQYRWHEITHDGLDFKVWGYKVGTTITWDPNLPENRRNWEHARSAVRARAPRKYTSVGSGPLDTSPKSPAPPEAARPKASEPAKGKAPAGEVGQIPNFGLAPERIGRKSEYTAGTPEARRFVEEAKAQATDAGRLHVTVIGTADDCAPVVNDIRTHPALAAYRDRIMVQDYRPDEWAVDPKLGFQTNGKPTIVIQQARGPRDANGGRVVYRAMDYSIGAEGLAEAIHKADPSYRPERDPGPATGRSGSCPLGFTSNHWPAILVVGIALAFVFLRPAQKEPRP